MKFLVDNPLSPLVARMLHEAGYDSVHVRDYNLQAASDSLILERAIREDRIIITADTDFGFLLARSGYVRPSVILFHHSFSHRPEHQGKTLALNLPQLSSALENGSLIVIESTRIRIRSLPILG